MLNVIGAIFANESEAFQAMTEMRQLPASDESAVVEMALVKRENDKFTVADSYDSGIPVVDNALAGGLIGSIVGIILGPVGVLLMGSYGALVGSAVGMTDSIGGAALVETVAGKLPEDGTAVVILAEEEEESVLDDALNKFDVEVFRFDAYAVAQEVEEAVKLESEMARQARVQLREAARAERKAKIEESAENMKKLLTD